MIRHLKDLEGDVVIQRLLLTQIEESIAQCLNQIKVPTFSALPGSGEGVDLMAKFMLQQALKAAFM